MFQVATTNMAKSNQHFPATRAKKSTLSLYEKIKVLDFAVVNSSFGRRNLQRYSRSVKTAATKFILFILHLY